MIFERREKKKYLTLLTFSINNHQKHQPHQIQSDVREWIPRNTTQHQRDTFVCWRAVISSRWLHIRAKAYARHLTTIQIKDSYAQKLYKIYPIKKDRWILISWWKKKKKWKAGLQREFSVGMQATHPWQISTRTNISTLFILVPCVAVFPLSSSMALAMLRPSRCTRLCEVIKTRGNTL